MLETCGKVIESQASGMLAPIMLTLKEWSSTAHIPILDNRIRFKIIDVIELRQKGWKARIEKEEAKKISEIHKQDKKEKQMAKNQTKMNRRM